MANDQERPSVVGPGLRSAWKQAVKESSPFPAIIAIVIAVVAGLIALSANLIEILQSNYAMAIFGLVLIVVFFAHNMFSFFAFLFVGDFFSR